MKLKYCLLITSITICSICCEARASKNKKKMYDADSKMNFRKGFLANFPIEDFGARI